jgi:polysaccharide export outer membrane protein
MNKSLSRMAGLTLSAALWVGVASAQQATVGANTVQQSQKESLLIGAGDMVHVTIFREPDLETKARVTDAGDVTLPLAGSLHIAGLNPSQASAEVAARYESLKLLKHAQVSVLVDEYATQAISVIGEVQKPGSYPVSAPRSVIDVLAMAGGLTPKADEHIMIEHRGVLSGTQEVFLPNNSSDALAAQVKVYPGDIVMVQKAGIVYVLGDVHQPGGYIMQDDSKMTVLQAVALASGTNHTAIEGKVRLVRRTPGGTTETLLSLKDMQKGKVPDMALSANDVLWVPFSFTKNFVMSGSTILGVAGSAAVYHY